MFYVQFSGFTRARFGFMPRCHVNAGGAGGGEGEGWDGFGQDGFGFGQVKIHIDNLTDLFARLLRWIRANNMDLDRKINIDNLTSTLRSFTQFAPFGDGVYHWYSVGYALKRLHPRLFTFSPFGTGLTPIAITRRRGVGRREGV